MESDCEGDVTVERHHHEPADEADDVRLHLSADDMGSPNAGEDPEQLSALEAMLHEMKCQFGTVFEELSRIQYDDRQQKEWMEKANSYETQIAALTSTVDTLKEDLARMSEQMKTYGEEKEILLMELQRNGQLSSYCREKLNLKTEATTPQSDFDSGVNLPQQCEGWEGETTPLGLAPMVKPFMESLPTGQGEKATDGQFDSDSESVTVLANRSLALSEKLRAKYQELSSQESSNEGEEPNSSYEDTVLPGNKLNGDLQYSEENTENEHHDAAYNEKQRQRLTTEILASERKYCSTLWTLIDDYMSPLRQMNLLTSRELNMMFPPYLPQIYAQHCSILRKLEDRVLNWRWKGIVGDIFAKLTDTQENDLLSLYRDYVSDFSTALNTMNNWRLQSQKFSSFLKNHHHGRGSEGTDVTALLLAPVQRVAHYVLTIKELLKYTDHNHADRYYLVASLAILRNFLSQVTEETQHAVQLVQEGSKTRRSSRSAPSVKSSGSSCDVHHLPSARDSGILSAGDDVVKLHHSPPPKQIVSRRSRHSGEPQAYNRSVSDNYSRRMRLVASQSNINRLTPSGGTHRSESPYNMAQMNGRPRMRDRQRRPQGRKTMDSFPIVHNMLPHRSASPAVRHSAVPRLQLDEYFDPVLDSNESRSYREPPRHKRPQSAVGRSCLYDDFEMDRLSHLAHNRPHSAAEDLLLRDEMFHTDAEAQLQRMLDLQERSDHAQAKSAYRRERLSLTPDEEYYGVRSRHNGRPRDLRTLAGMDHLLESGLIMRAQSPHGVRQEEQFAKDYGIYGDNDDVDDEDVDGPSSLPSVSDRQAELADRGQLLKSKSQGNMISTRPTDGLDAKVSEAKRLKERSATVIASANRTNGDIQGHFVPIDDQKQNVHVDQQALNRPQDQHPQHQHPTVSAMTSVTGDTVPQQAPAAGSPPHGQDEVAVTSVPPPASTLPRPDSQGMNGVRLRTPKKKGREKAKLGFSPSSLSKSVDDVSKHKKKNSIRDSLKSIFNKKKWTAHSRETNHTPEILCSSELQSNLPFDDPSPPPYHLNTENDEQVLSSDFLLSPRSRLNGPSGSCTSPQDDFYSTVDPTVTPADERTAPLASPDRDFPDQSRRRSCSLVPTGETPLPRILPPRKPPRLRRPATLTGSLTATFRDELGEPYSPV